MFCDCDSSWPSSILFHSSNTTGNLLRISTRFYDHSNFSSLIPDIVLDTHNDLFCVGIPKCINGSTQKHLHYDEKKKNHTHTHKKNKKKKKKKTNKKKQQKNTGLEHKLSVATHSLMFTRFVAEFLFLVLWNKWAYLEFGVDSRELFCSYLILFFSF